MMRCRNERLGSAKIYRKFDPGMGIDGSNLSGHHIFIGSLFNLDAYQKNTSLTRPLPSAILSH